MSLKRPAIWLLSARSFPRGNVRGSVSSLVHSAEDQGRDISFHHSRTADTARQISMNRNSDFDMDIGHKRHSSVAEEAARHQPKLPKKLVVCCDGTWMDRDGYEPGKWGKPGKVPNPSNVTRIARAIMPEDDQKHPQITYYQAGIGTGIGLYAQLLGGATGLGLSENVREAYAFLASNYSPRDDVSDPDSIFLIGFSRGAFTARTLGGFIAAMGILTRDAMPHFYECFKDWENAGVDDYKPQFFEAYAQANPELKIRDNIPKFEPPQSPDENAIDKYLKAYRKYLQAFGLTNEAKIKCIGVWDTVGALGIPINPFLQRTFGLPAFIREYRWFDTRLDDHYENAFQALALDEHRSPYSPAVWELDQNGTTNLKQVWFAGAHSNIGGSYEDYGQANITLAWMMDQLSGNTLDTSKKEFDPVDWIRFDDKYIDKAFKHNQYFYDRQPDKGKGHRGWAMGKVYDSNTFPQNLAGARTRTPGRYRRTDFATSNYTRDMLHNTEEYIHSSVRARIDLNGREVEFKTFYQKAARYVWRALTMQKQIKPYRPTRKHNILPASGGPLEGWKLIDGHQYHDQPNMEIHMSPGGMGPEIRWEYEGTGKTSTSVLKEDVFADKGYEWKLLQHDGLIAEQVMFSNNRWHWFKKPVPRHEVAKTF